ncbi:unnamed protein product, partial [Brenthis ino]
MTTTASPSPSKIPTPSPLPLPLPPYVTKLIRQKSEIFPPKEVIDNKAEAHYNNILESINESKNIKTSIKENIAFHAEKLLHMVDAINCDMTDLAREVLAAVMERLDQAPEKQKQTQEMTELNTKMEKLMEQVITQNLDLKKEISELKAEIKEIKEEKSNTGLMEELQKQNIATEKTQKHLQEIKEDIKAIPISQPTPTEKPNTTPESYSHALQQASLPKPTLCLLVASKIPQGADNNLLMRTTQPAFLFDWNVNALPLASIGPTTSDCSAELPILLLRRLLPGISKWEGNEGARAESG